MTDVVDLQAIKDDESEEYRKAVRKALHESVDEILESIDEPSSFALVVYDTEGRSGLAAHYGPFHIDMFPEVVRNTLLRLGRE